MLRFWKALKTGEKILFGGVVVLILVTISNYAILEVVRARTGRTMFPVRTHYDFAGEGFRGSELFRVNNCTNCHKAVGNGTNMGLNLDGMGSRHDLAYIERFLHDPEGTYPSRTVDHGLPPKEAAYVGRIPEADLHAIAVFLSQLKSDRGAASAEAPPPGRIGAVDAFFDMWVPDSWRLLGGADVRDTPEEKKEGAAVAPAPASAPAAAPGAASPSTQRQQREREGRDERGR